MKSIRFLMVISLLLVAGMVGAQTASPSSMILATTTSTQQTGLLDVLLPAFTKATGIEVKPIAVGTGKALELAKNGDADAVMVHARKLEDAFVADGFGVEAWDLMFNDFVIVGPQDDPAKLQGSKTAVEALKKVLDQKAKFVSRGDKSGTQEKELALWQEATAKPAGEAYVEAGQGMTETLKMAGDLKAYTLCDRATWIVMKKKVPMSIVYENPEELKNPYGVMAVSNKKAEKAKTDLGLKFVEWVVSEPAQKIISDYKMEGEILFHLSVKKR